MQQVEWRVAAGSCGHTIGERVIEAAYVNGVAMFAFEARSGNNSPKFYSCVVTGRMTCGGASLDEVKQAGIDEALRYGTLEADRKMSRKQFEAVVADTTRLR
jgi:hypothetical protein